MSSSYGSPKSSSGSTPSESSGSSLPDESSSGSSGYLDSSSSGGSSSSGPCSFYIAIVLYITDDKMDISIFNDGAVMLEITGITGIVPLTPDPAFPIFVLPATGTSFTVEATGIDLRATPFTVQTSCGDQGGTFPAS